MHPGNSVMTRMTMMGTGVQKNAPSRITTSALSLSPPSASVCSRTTTGAVQGEIFLTGITATDITSSASTQSAIKSAIASAADVSSTAVHLVAARQKYGTTTAIAFYVVGTSAQQTNTMLLAMEDSIGSDFAVGLSAALSKNLT